MRTTVPALDASQRHLLATLDTLDALASYLVAQDERRRDLLWATADVLAAWVASRGTGGPVTPLYKALAQATGWSSRFVRDLVRTAMAFPPEARARYADKAWQWFAECLREGDPLETAERYADLSVREIRDYRRTRHHRPQEPGYVRLSVTLRPDHVQELEATGRVGVSAVLPDGHEARVIITRGPRIMARALRDPLPRAASPILSDRPRDVAGRRQ
jgi:hypothetical protein